MFIIKYPAVCTLNSIFLLSTLYQVGDLHINTTTCGYPCWAHFSAVLSCLLSTGGPLYSHTPSKSSSTFTSQSRSQVSCVKMFGSVLVRSRAECFSNLGSPCRCELGFIQAGSDVRECSQQRLVSVKCWGPRQELQVKFSRAPNVVPQNNTGCITVRV